jgi:hypothetical protein
MDLNETKIREEIEFWQQFIDKWKAMRNEPVHTIALESLAQAEKKLQCYLLARDILASRKAKGGVGDRTGLE